MKKTSRPGGKAYETPVAKEIGMEPPFRFMASDGNQNTEDPDDHGILDW